MTLNEKLSKALQNRTLTLQKLIFRSQTTANDTKYLLLYNKRVIALISANIVPSWDIYGCSQARVLQFPTITLYSGLFSEHTGLLKDLLGDVSSVVLTLLLITRLSKTESGIFISWLISLLPKDLLFRFYSFQLRNRSAVD